MHIDVEAIIKSKNPKVYRFIPRFLFRLVAKLICQDEVNEMLRKLEGKQGVEFITGALDDLQIKREIEGIEYLDPSKRYIFAANHPLGGLDGLAIAEAINARMKDVRVLVNDVLMNLSPLSGIFLPVNKYGKQNVAYLNTLNEVLEGNIPILYFPAGLCSRKIKGEVTDLEWKKNFMQKAIETKRDVVPVYVDEVNSSFFYWLSNFRKRLGIKLNIEMMLLPGELFRRREARIRILFGKPIAYTVFVNDGCSLQEKTELVRKACYKLSER